MHEIEGQPVGIHTEDAMIEAAPVEPSQSAMTTGLKADAPSFANQSEFFDYFETTWLDGMFPVRMWNVYALEGPCTQQPCRRMVFESAEAGRKSSSKHLRSSHFVPVQASCH